MSESAVLFFIYQPAKTLAFYIYYKKTESQAHVLYMALLVIYRAYVQK